MTEKEAEILKDVPTNFRNTLSAYAYREHHSGGYQDVLGGLSDLISYLEPCFRGEK